MFGFVDTDASGAATNIQLSILICLVNVGIVQYWRKKVTLFIFLKFANLISLSCYVTTKISHESIVTLPKNKLEKILASWILYMSQLAERRCLVKALWEGGHKEVADLLKITGFPKKSLYRWVAQLAETNDLKQGKRPGRPKKLTSKQRRYLGLIATGEECATSSELTEILNDKYPDLNITARTIRDNLKQLGYKVCVPRPTLTKKAMKRRVAWAQAHLNKRWGRTVFSDESTFQLFRNTIRVRYKSGKSVPTRGVVKHRIKSMYGDLFVRRGSSVFTFFQVL